MRSPPWRARCIYGRSMIELSWSAPEGCPTVEVVEQRVERILNRPLEAEQQALTVKAVVSPASDTRSWSVMLESTSGQRRASRTLEAASCDELASATAVFLAILIEPDQGAPEPQSAPAPAPAPNITVPRAPAKREPARFALGVTASIRSAGLPTWAAGGGVHGALSWQALRGSVGVSGWLPVDETIEGSENQGASLQLSSGYAKLCWQARTAPLVPAVCGGAELSVLRGRGFGPDVRPQSATALFGSLLGGGTLRLRSTEHLAVLLEADALVPLGDRQVVLAGGAPAQIYQPSWGLQLACGAEWSF
jgi:hypothetical protein